jgi:hypothetical protein
MLVVRHVVLAVERVRQHAIGRTGDLHGAQSVNPSIHSLFTSIFHRRQLQQAKAYMSAAGATGGIGWSIQVGLI